LLVALYIYDLKNNFITMKKLFVVLAMLAAMTASGQWQPDVRLTNNPAESNTSQSNAWSVAANGNILHLIWQDRRDGYDIYYKRSTDGGTSWGADIRLTGDSADAGTPALAVSGSFVHVAWIDHRYGSNQLFYKRSTDGGTNWGADTRLVNNTAGSYYPSIAVSASIVHIVFNQYLNGYSELCYKRSTDGGTSWGADTWLTNNGAGTAFSPSVAVNGALVQVAWCDSHEGNFEIYHKRSTDSGANWGAVTRLTNTSTTSYTPTIAVTASIVQVVWQEYINSKWQLKHILSTDGGTSWGTIFQLTNSTGNSVLSNIAVSASSVHLVWSDDRNGNDEIYYKRSTNSGISWGTDSRLTIDTNGSLNPSVAVSGSVVNVVWRDTRNGSTEIYYKRNPTGNVGIQNISTEIPSEYSLGQNYPNPFNNTSNLKFEILNLGYVKLVVYDIQGREVQTLVNEALQPGTYETTFDGSMLSSGVYFYKISTGDYSETKRLTLLK
jgi:hypothetical protein